jgi:hypothetical protein
MSRHPLEDALAEWAASRFPGSVEANDNPRVRAVAAQVRRKLEANGRDPAHADTVAAGYWRSHVKRHGGAYYGPHCFFCPDGDGRSGIRG